MVMLAVASWIGDLERRVVGGAHQRVVLRVDVEEGPAEEPEADLHPRQDFALNRSGDLVIARPAKIGTLEPRWPGTEVADRARPNLRVLRDVVTITIGPRALVGDDAERIVVVGRSVALDGDVLAEAELHRRPPITEQVVRAADARRDVRERHQVVNRVEVTFRDPPPGRRPAHRPTGGTSRSGDRR